MNARTLLAPLGAAYGAAGALRVALYGRGLLRRHRLAGPVVSVGNLSVGGSGKTPVVALVARLLQEAGLPVSVLSRGYGGSFRGDALVVSDGADVRADAVQAGDEPAMLARHLPGVVVAVGPRRERVGRLVEQRFGRRVHVLDDGFQHLRLHRDLDLLCATPADLVDAPLPAGRLRERPSAAGRASALLLAGANGDAPPEEGPQAPRVFHLRRRVEGFFDRAGLQRPAPARAFLLAGIARPERFLADVAASAGSAVGSAVFRDHHWFTPEELLRAADRARHAGADAVVTTAKDAERLPPGWEPLPVVVLRIAAEVEEPGRFRDLVVGAVRSAW
jgi:tetraacyldisaccharide 4'-kinase